MGYIGKEPRKDGGSLTLGATLDANGNEIVLDADADSSITADTDDQIDIKVAGSDLAHITSTYAKLRGATPLVFGENNSTGTFQSISGEVGANNLLLRSYQSLTFKNGTSGSSLTDGTTAFNIDTNGHVTMPLQPAVFVKTGNDADKTGDGTTHTCELDNEIYDVNADFNVTNFTFTAPVTGKYFMSATISLEGISSHERVRPVLVTSNRSYTSEFHGDNMFSSNAVLQINSISTVADMDANDTATFTIRVDGGGKSVDIRDETSLSIALVC